MTDVHCSAVSGMRLALAFSIPSAMATPRMRRGLPCNEYPFSSLRTFIANSRPSSPVFYKRAASCLFSLSLACSRTFYVRFQSCHQEVIDVSSCFLLDVFSRKHSHCTCPAISLHPSGPDRARVQKRERNHVLDPPLALNQCLHCRTFNRQHHQQARSPRPNHQSRQHQLRARSPTTQPSDQSRQPKYAPRVQS